ncbi:MAG: TonB-dependent receptor plug domain-containing protein, partial [Gammaproteobacteria bacterium]|nr:TonB-dependent receptor plug domain-containing protein [Gammaproteobacteria bacterium]
MVRGRVLIWLSAAILLPSAAVCAQEAEPDSADGDDRVVENFIEEVIVTGTRIKRRDFSSPSPLATIDREDFEFSGQPTLEEYLNQMPQVQPGLGRAVNNGGDGTATLNLRGMGAGRTLVLLNGRRLSPSGVGSAVDVNNLPGVLVERVEIITGGASTVYGSDAIAGVVNFITRDDFAGLGFEGTYNVSGEGDAEIYDFNVAYGHNFADGRGNVTAYAGYYERKELFAAERKLTRSVWGDIWYVPPIAGELVPWGSNTVPGGVIFAPRADLGSGPVRVTWDPDGTPRAYADPADRYNYQPVNYLQTPLERKTVGVMGHLSVSERYEAYFEGSYAENDATLTLAPAPAFTFVAVNTDNPVLTSETRELFEEQFLVAPGTAVFGLSRRMLELGPRIINPRREYTRLVAGIRGALGSEWEMDAWLTWTDADLRERRLNDGSLSRLQQGLLVDPATGQCFDNSGGCVPLDVFGEGRLSQEGVDFIRVENVENSSSRKQLLASVIATGPAFEIWSGSVDVAVGAEWRRDQGSFQADDLLFTGDTMSFRGNASVDGTEQVYELYGEAVVPLYEKPDGSRRLGLELGARWSDYDHAGSVWTWKAGLDWQVLESLR